MSHGHALLVVFLGAALASAAHAKPSFDCAKAQSDTEKTICRSGDLQWFDRQLARLYKLARDPLTPDGTTLRADQHDFLARRDRCGDGLECIWQAYEKRLTEVARWVDLYEPYAEYERPRAEMSGGKFWIVRFGFDAAVKIWASTDGKQCALDTESAIVTGRGVVRWVRGVCRITIIPDGEDLIVQTKNCESYCGMRAVLDGGYSHAR